ncbi:MAG TPA: hypothetical protein PKV72_06460 [Candidatus Peribacteria bacterium]|nr:hypothetical protein [Candidatus Peribacteria bacterium]
MPTLYLTPFEQKLVRSDLLKEWKWTLGTETLQSYETPEELDQRMKLLSRGNNAELEKLAKKITAKLDLGQELDKLMPEDVSDEAFTMLLFGIGALGMTALIEILGRDAKSQDDLFNMAALTAARHALLEANTAQGAAK